MLKQSGNRLCAWISMSFQLLGIDVGGTACLGPQDGRCVVRSGSSCAGSVIDALFQRLQRRLGFDNILNTRFPNLSALPSLETHGDPQRTKRIIARTFHHQTDITAVYVMSSEARIPVTHVSDCYDLSKLAVIVHERTPFTEAAIRDEQIDAIIAQNPGHAVRSAIRIMRARSDHRLPLASQEKIRIEVLLKENL